MLALLVALFYLNLSNIQSSLLRFVLDQLLRDGATASVATLPLQLSSVQPAANLQVPLWPLRDLRTEESSVPIQPSSGVLASLVELCLFPTAFHVAKLLTLLHCKEASQCTDFPTIRFSRPCLVRTAGSSTALLPGLHLPVMHWS